MTAFGAGGLTGDAGDAPLNVVRPTLDSLTVGDTVATATAGLDRAALVRYAGASGDFNPIHWNEAEAVRVGLPGVIAHGMLTMGWAVTAVENWCGDPGMIVQYRTRFTRPIPVLADAAASVTATATVGAVDLEARTARIDLTVVHDAARVLGRAQAVVQF